eukprot:TRINITY_DN1159_c0_g1_i4.p1 TRINITY_DN1159_c0_g1~~TRINITY_DN1159_c0_g1_i4.p1  ORF type:complete len:297 (+),score=77.28 TRINITY_DN1159_c0_g1_i4:678-1568(+)
MCIFTGKVRVSATNILVSITKDGENQFTVYSNEVHLSKEPVAMILPFPNTSSNPACEMVDLSAFPDFFKNVDMMFPKLTKTKSRAKLATKEKGKQKLEVKRCGSYSYSVVPSVTEFDDLEQDVFNIEEDLIKMLTENYKENFGFLVCIIDKSDKYSPIAYFHPILDNKLFVPTRHEHGNGEKRPKWDHSIYTLGSADAEAGQISGAVYEGNVMISNFIAPERLKNVELPLKLHPELVRKRKVHGPYDNVDLHFNCADIKHYKSDVGGSGSSKEKGKRKETSDKHETAKKEAKKEKV